VPNENSSISHPIGRPEAGEAAPYYFRYIDLVPSGDVLGVLETQHESFSTLLSSVSEEASLFRYEPGKWSIREALNHVNDTERVFLWRAFWFARGFESALASFDQDPCVAAARADDFSWASHLEDFRAVRHATLTFFRNLSPAALLRKGTASDNVFTVRALASIAAGHVAHHSAILRDRYGVKG
jgi:DinB superfamily